MAGQKITRRAINTLDKIGEEQIFQVYLQTRSVKKVIEALDLTFSTNTFYRWLNDTPERRERWEENKRRIAERLVEKQLEVAESVERREDVPAAQLKVKTYQWTAGKYDRAKYGDDRATVAVQVNLTDQWLEALEQLDREQELEEKEKEIVVEEGEGDG